MQPRKLQLRTNRQRRDDAMADARQTRREREAYLDAGYMVCHLRPVRYYVDKARRFNRAAIVDRMWREGRYLPRILTVYSP